MFDKSFKKGDYVVVVSTNEYIDENKIARKCIFYGKVLKISKDRTKLTVKNNSGEKMECSSLAVLYTVVPKKKYLAELEEQMNKIFTKYLDVKTLFAILKLEDDWFKAARICGLYHWI